jgi:hypothetical protein
MMQIKVPLEALPARRRWPAYTAIALTTLSVATAIVGTVMIVLSRVGPGTTGVTRNVAVQAANDRFVEGRTSIVLLATAGGLAATAATLAVVFRKDIFGIGASQRASLELAPGPGGVMASATVRW